MTEIQTFQPVFPTNGYDLRAMIIGGEPWFVAADVCGALGLTNPKMVVSRLDGADVSQADISSSGQTRKMSIINESGLYELIMRSNKPEARVFRRWVTSEVLPSIRKTGAYGAQRALSRMELLELAMAAEKEAMAARGELERMQPAIEAHAQYMRANNTVAMGTAAKVLSIGPNALFALLREKRVLISTAGARFNTPYQQYILAGWFEVKAGSFEHNSGEVEATYTTRVTPKGIEGIRAMIEVARA
jgi:anti-repressor protein